MDRPKIWLQVNFIYKCYVFGNTPDESRATFTSLSITKNRPNFAELTSSG